MDNFLITLLQTSPYTAKYKLLLNNSMSYEWWVIASFFIPQLDIKCRGWANHSRHSGCSNCKVFFLLAVSNEAVTSDQIPLTSRQIGRPLIYMHMPSGRRLLDEILQRKVRSWPILGRNLPKQFRLISAMLDLPIGVSCMATPSVVPVTELVWFSLHCLGFDVNKTLFPEVETAYKDIEMGNIIWT